MPEWIPAEEARAAVDRDRVLQLDSRRLEPLAQSAQIIDQEVRRLIEEAEGKARQILTDHLEDLHLIAKALLA